MNQNFRLGLDNLRDTIAVTLNFVGFYETASSFHCIQDGPEGVSIA